MIKITVAAIRKHSPCYDPLKIKGVTEETELTLTQCMQFEGGSDADKVWLATRFMTELQNRTFAIWCARSCKTKIKEITEYIDAIENYYIKKTITEEQLSAADRAAYSAAYRTAYRAADRAADRAAYSAADSAADRAAYWAAYSAADSAADSAAYSAADWAAYSAADRAAYSAADFAAYSAADRAADWAKQVSQITKMLKGEK
jgi:hypothetical protein